MTTTAIIPTYGRGQVLLDTLGYLRSLAVAPAKILVVDQTPYHAPEIERQLRHWEQGGTVHILRLGEPSIPKAMNTGLLAARTELVLFLDDDIIPGEGLITAHERAHAQDRAAVVAGRVIQPWDDERGAGSGFNSTEPRWVGEFMGGNFSIRQDNAIALGGFDENFVRVAYRFEKEFADRVLDAGGQIRYEPAAVVRHLKVGDGGNRRYRDRTVDPGHGVGEYYYFLRSRRVSHKARHLASRMLKSVSNRFHLRHPWRIPMTLSVELRACLWAMRLYQRGPRILAHGADGTVAARPQPQ